MNPNMLKSEYFSGSTITFGDEVVSFDESGKASASKEAEAHLAKAETIELLADKKEPEQAKKTPAKKPAPKRAPAKKSTTTKED